MPCSCRWAAAISVFNIKVLEFLYSLRQFLTDTLCWVLIWKSAFRAFLTLGVMCMTAWKTHLITNKDLAYWENKTDHSFIQCSKKGFTASKRRVLPSVLTPYPGGQVVCATQVIHSSEEQWNPSLHMHTLCLSLLCSGTRKFRSERRMDTSYTLRYIKNTSTNIGAIWFNLSHGLTWVAVWLTLTLGFLCVFFLIFILLTCLALRFLAHAEGRHAGSWKTWCGFMVKIRTNKQFCAAF